VQTGLSMSVSPDNGFGTRMSYLRQHDRADGGEKNATTIASSSKTTRGGRTLSASRGPVKRLSLATAVPHKGSAKQQGHSTGRPNGGRRSAQPTQARQSSPHSRLSAQRSQVNVA
jgi:hypothetical protein